MRTDELRPGIHWVGAIDWDRRSFDELVPIPAGTTYNAYLVRGSERTALIDTVEPHRAPELLGKLERLGVKSLDYVVSNHAEQDHSGALPAVLERYPGARLLATPLARDLLAELLGIDKGRIEAAEDGARLPLGGRTLRFLHVPWVHWPETMLTYLEEDRTLFPCDLFGAHLAGAPLQLAGDARLPMEAKRYYACIMMPHRELFGGALRRLRELPIDLVAPSHGPVHPAPAGILEAYRGWVEDPPWNLAVIPWVSMHESTHRMVEVLVEALEANGVEARPFNLGDPDLGKLAMDLVDAATVVFACPAVLGRLHPKMTGAAALASALQPKARWLGLIGSYGWGAAMVEDLQRLVDLDAEALAPVLVRGAPGPDAIAALRRLAEDIARRHQGLGEAAPPPGTAFPPPALTSAAGPTAAADFEPVPAAPAAAEPAAPGGPRTGDLGPRYRCKQCGWVYDPALGDPRSGVAPGTPFADLPDGYLCPVCEVGKRRFKAV
jgi:flavorubredoxin/rubredoxin